MSAVDDVGIHCTVIPDGWTTLRNGKVTARVSLVLTPDVRNDPLGLTVDLKQWPQQISKLANLKSLPLVIAVKPLDGGKIAFHRTTGITLDPALTQNGELANKLWQNIFNPPNGPDDPNSTNLFANLKNALKATQAATASPAMASLAIDKGAARPQSLGQAAYQKRLSETVAVLRDVSVNFGSYNLRAVSNLQQGLYLDELFNTFHETFLQLRFSGLLGGWHRRLEGSGRTGLSASAVEKQLEAAIEEKVGSSLAGSLTASFATAPFSERILSGLQRMLLNQLARLGLANQGADPLGNLDRFLSRNNERPEIFSDLLQNVATTQLSLQLVRPEENVAIDAANLIQHPGAGRNALLELLRLTAQNGLPKSLNSVQQQIQKNFTAFRQHWRNNPTRETPPPLGSVQADNDAAQRKFVGIRAQPTLAKFLRLTVDVTIEIADGEKIKDGQGIIAASFIDNPTDDQACAAAFEGARQPAWTAYTFKTPTPKPTGMPSKAVVTPAAALAPASPADPGYFRPCGTKEYLGIRAFADDLKFAPHIENGAVNLNEKDEFGPRYRIAVLDMPAALNALRVKAEQDSGAERNGSLPESTSTKLPDRQSRGLQLFDRFTYQDMSMNLLRLAQNAQPGEQDSPYFAESLVVGYRPFIQRQRPNGNANVGSPPPWRSLVARQVRIDEIASALTRRRLEQLSPDWHPYPQFKSRDHGMVRPAHKIQSDKNGDQATTDQQMFSWMGASMGLSADLRREVDKESEGDTAGQSSRSDLAVGTEYNFSRAAEDKLAILRTGQRYRMGLVPAYLNGASPSFEETSWALNGKGTGEVALGGDTPNSRFFDFAPPRDLPPPEVLISDADFRLWKAAEIDGAKTADRGNGETLERVIIRTAASPKNDKDSVRRYLVPPRTSFERAEQAGLFDTNSQLKPDGAFAEYELDDTYGSFPTGDGQASTREKAVPPEERGRTTILRLRGGNRQPKDRHYIDPLAQNLFVAFNRGGAVPAGFPDEQPERKFWKDGQSSTSAQPIELVVRRWREGSYGGRFNGPDRKGTITGARGAFSRTIDRLAIELAPAEQVELLIWCGPSAREFIKHRADVRQISVNLVAGLVSLAPGRQNQDKVGILRRVREHLDDIVYGLEPADNKSLSAEEKLFKQQANKALDTVFTAVLSQTPDNGLTGSTRLQIVHAVEKPLQVPVLPYRAFKDETKQPELTFRPIRVRRKTSWDDFVKNSNLTAAEPLKALDAKSEPEGTTAYFVGQIEFDRASTKGVRFEASWPDLRPASAITYDEKTNIYTFEPLRKDRPLFEAAGVTRDRGVNPANRLDLTYTETGLLRALSFPFEDTSARELSIRMIATSRFDNDFPPEPGQAPSEIDALGRFDQESRPPAGAKRATGPKRDEYRTYKIMMPATAAPSVPTIKRIDWVMPETLKAFEQGRRICVEKNFFPRIYLSSDWLSATSGEHELFALICAPGDLAANRPYDPDRPSPPALEPIPLSPEEQDLAPGHRDIFASQFDAKELSALRETVCRWGGDPTTRSTDLPGLNNTLTGLITRERFSGFVASRDNVEFAGQRVSLLLYKPQFDRSTGEFYVDIGIDPGSAHSPFVELACARYQPYVIEEKLHLSGVVRVKPFQVTPQRTVEVLIQNGTLRAIVQGIGYTDRSPEIPGHLNAVYKTEYESRIRQPLQSFKVIGLGDEHAGSGLQVNDAMGAPLLHPYVAPAFPAPVAPSLFTSGSSPMLRSQMTWISKTFKLPLTPAQYHYGIEINEVDLHFPDEAYESDRPVDLVERPAKFSLTIDVNHGLFVPRDPPLHSRG